MDTESPSQTEELLDSQAVVSGRPDEPVSWLKRSNWTRAGVAFGIGNTALLTYVAINQMALQKRLVDFEQRQRSQEIRIFIGTTWRDGFNKNRNRIMQFKRMLKDWPLSTR